MTGLAGNGYLIDEVVRFLLLEYFKPHRYKSFKKPERVTKKEVLKILTSSRY